jgi:hypothetical protein
VRGKGGQSISCTLPNFSDLLSKKCGDDWKQIVYNLLATPLWVSLNEKASEVAKLSYKGLSHLNLWITCDLSH